MKSRMEKYYTEKPSYNRTTRNASLYKEVYGNYANLENLPIADNTNEIDIKDLQEIVKSNTKSKERNLEVLEENALNTVRKQEEQREYDINKILEKVKSTRQPKEERRRNTSPTYKFLTTLESQEIPVTEVKKAYQEYERKSKNDLLEKQPEEKEEIYMTRELKFHEKQLEVTREINLMKIKESSPLDLLEDLKPDGNSFIAEPVKPEKNSIFATSETEEIDETPIKVKEIQKETKEVINIDNEDIDIIKKETFRDKEVFDNDFYTSSYKFSKRDFIDEDDDFYDEPKKGFGILKVFFLLLAIFFLTAIIYYFISKYGVGI